MTSSVAVRSRSKARRIECCLASSREKTVTCAGRPTSPVSRRLTSTLPSEPVPPVTTTLLPVSMIPNFLVRSGVVRHALYHPGPRPRRKARLAPEPRAVETTVADEFVVGLNLRVEPVRVPDQRQEVELVNRFGGDVPDAAQALLLGDDVAEDVCERLRRGNPEDGAPERRPTP